jgi:hypothetical protein
VARPPSDWLTLAQASEMLEAANVRFRPSTIGAWARRGSLQSIKVGGRRYVRRAEVRRLITPRRQVRLDPAQAALFEELGD